MPRLRIFILFFNVFALINTSKAQDLPHFIESLTTEDGLSSNNINDIVQDDDGFLWIATADGLNRFDGTEIKQFFHQNNDSSLPHNYIYCIKKLPGNILAIGTQSGLSFYDGRKFSNFYYQKNNSLDEYNNIITHLAVDKYGQLWAASKGCVFIFNKDLSLKKVIPSPFNETDANSRRLKFVEKIIALPSGHMLFYLFDGWYVFEPGANNFMKLEQSVLGKSLSFLKTSYPTTLKSSTLYYPAAKLFQVFEKYLLYIPESSDSIILFDDKGRQLSSVYFPYNKYPFVSWSQQVSGLDSNNIIFSLHANGIIIIPLAWRNGMPELKPVSKKLFDEYEYKGSIKDKQNNWWLATEETGLQKVDPHKQHFKLTVVTGHIPAIKVTHEVNSFSRYGNTRWISTYGDGFFSMNTETGRQEQFNIINTGDDPWGNFVWNIRQINDDSLWVGTQTGMFWYALKTKKYGRLTKLYNCPPVLDSVPITTQFLDSRGIVWMGLGKGKGLCNYDRSSGKFKIYPGGMPNAYPFRYPISISEDPNSDLWFASDGTSNLLKWNRADDNFEVRQMPKSLQKQISNITSVLCASNGIVWAGTVTSGLIKYDTKTGTAILYGHDKGLVNGHVNSIYIDNSNRVWLSTDAGISCLPNETENFINFLPSDGIPVKFPTASFFYDKEEKLLFNGGYGAMFYFDPNAKNTPQAAQKTMITAIYVNNHLYPLDINNSMKLGAKQNNISLHYSAIDLSNGSSTQYSYRLIGEDTTWVFAGSQRQINFSQLAPGNYRFMVRAANKNGEWSNDIATIRFSIKPPFTRTAWFYILAALLMGGIFYGLYWFRLRQLKRTEQVRAEISRNLHDEVGSTLTNISLGSLLAQKQLNDQQSVSKILERIYQDSQNISVAIREIIWSINPEIDTLGEALPRMLQYASELLEAKDIDLQAQITPEIEQMKLSMEQRRDLYLIFKEAVNNLAKHSKASKAMVKFQSLDNFLLMVVSDNGKGFDQTMPLHNNGLKNMLQRAEFHKWQLAIQSNQGSGTIISLKAAIA